MEIDDGENSMCDMQVSPALTSFDRHCSLSCHSTITENFKVSTAFTLARWTRPVYLQECILESDALRPMYVQQSRGQSSTRWPFTEAGHVNSPLLRLICTESPTRSLARCESISTMGFVMKRFRQTSAI